MSSPSSGLPIDWTNGTGAFSGTTINIPANNNRKWLYIENLDTTSVTVTFAGVQGSAPGTASTVNFPLGPATAAGGPGGGVLDRHLFNFLPLGAITITGTSGKQITAVEG